MANVLVTGATGFIGTHLVRHLTLRGDRVTCLVRSNSDRSGLLESDPEFQIGDLSDDQSIQHATQGKDVVFHLAGTTKTLRPIEFQRANVDGAQRIARCCSQAETPPTLIHVSSLAAAGPSEKSRPRTETDSSNPISNYGKSKLRGEIAVRKFSGSLPLSIIRPPIVLGPGDRDGFEMFKGIADWATHFVPGFTDHDFSVIHVDDLCAALLCVADQGKRVAPDANNEQGIYFASEQQILTYAELGHMIGRSLGKRRVRILRGPISVIWAVAGINEAISRLRGRPHILNWDKTREAKAGSWACSSDRLRQETNFLTAKTLQERIDETASWYIEHAWIKK